jgi:hypothetical protein
MIFTFAESLAIKAFGLLAILAGGNIAIKRFQYESDPERSNDPAVVKGITWVAAAVIIFIGYKALKLNSKS